MTILITDTGFAPCESLAQMTIASDTDPATVEYSDASLIAIAFPHAHDGRGFGIARVLRRRGYRGVLRASGHIISDQYAMARRCGFDEVEIPDDLAARQPQSEWQFRAEWQKDDYQAHLGQKRA